MRPDITPFLTWWIIVYCGLASLQGMRNVTHYALPDADLLLLCTFPVKAVGLVRDGDHVVFWTQSGGALLQIMRTGRVNFSNPKEGRVKVFPHLCLEGNCSIFIEHLQPSDQGEYCCVLHNTSMCSVVAFATNNSDLDERTRVDDKWFIIGGGVGGISFVLLIFCFCCVKFQFSADSAPSETSCSFPQGGDAEDIVYENDDHDPNSAAHVETEHHQETPCNSTTQQPKTAKPFYVNQGEIDKQLELRKEMRQKKRLQYENPIYANSNEQLDQV
ncbi:hypothetical protein GJAV_G00059540 [Gymnothorax javanicus]|nr:hypothetical protein GJAV_G00059540 [Gymnothorax javanicus]